MGPRTVHKIAAVAAAGVLACPAAALAGPVRIGEQYGLGLLGPETPAILKQAKADPYAIPIDCEVVNSELAQLNEALGPDAHEPPAKTNQVGKLVTKAIRGLIPHRDVVRFVTGAGRKESALQQAAMAGWARRGYLRGISRQMSCNGEQPLPVTQASAETPETSPAAPVYSQTVAAKEPQGAPAVEAAAIPASAVAAEPVQALAADAN